MMRKYLVILLYLLLIVLPSGAQPGSIIETYRNPVIPGIFPDPTIIRVGDTYYASGTSGNSVPVYPLYQSKDLINWNRIGSVFNEPPEWAAGDFWAPELFYNNGTFFVYYTARRKSDKVSCVGVATTTDPGKGFTDHGIIIDWGKEAIDAFVFKEGDGKLFITWKAYGLNRDRKVELLTSELSPDGLKLAGEPFSLTRYDKGWNGHGDDEGPCLTKHGDYYYLFYSGEGCCNNKCGYKLFVQRSKTLRGDWEQYSGGAILQGGEQWKCSGHGTLVETPDRRTFFLYHAFNVNDFEYIGREGLLDELMWDNKTGWPYFKYGKTPTSQAEVPFKNSVQKRELTFYDDFSTQSNMKYWQWDINNAYPGILISDNTLTIKNISEVISCIGINPKTGNYTAETCVVNKGENLKGLSISGSRSNMLGLATSGSKVILFQQRNGVRTILSEKDISSQTDKVWLRVVSTSARLFRFYWSVDQKEWIGCKDKDNNIYIDGTSLPGAIPSLMVGNGGENIGVFSYMKIDYVF
jgi:xylan 1,4-beta-xylosidase